MSAPTFLSLPRLPARLHTQQVAEVLGMQAHDIPILVHARLLKPIGSPHPHAVKFYASVEVEALARDRDWLDKAQRAIQRHWQLKNHGGLDDLHPANTGSGSSDIGRRDRRRATRVTLNANRASKP
jgi:hypothetical protein